MGKRGNNEGSIYKRKDGRWEARIIVGYKEDGKPRYKASYYPTKKAAQAYLQDTLYRVSRGMAPLDSTVTLDVWAETWLAAKRSTIEETTYSNYRFMLRHILPVLGKFKLTEIKTIHIQTLINDLHKAGNGRSTLEKVRSALYGMLQDAEINDMVLRNVCRGVKLPKKEKKQAKDAFTPEEVAIIEAYVGVITFCDVIAVLVNTGLREGEMIALRKQNLDVENGTIHITHAAKRTKTTSMELGTPKTPESVRSIPVPSHVMDILVSMAERSSSEYLLSTINGTMLNASNFRRAYKKATLQMGLRYLSPHCCRHTYATMLYAAGVDTKTIQTLMGHTDYALTANVYTHVKTAQLHHAVHALQAFKQSSEAKPANQATAQRIKTNDSNNHEAATVKI